MTSYMGDYERMTDSIVIHETEDIKTSIPVLTEEFIFKTNSDLFISGLSDWSKMIGTL